MRWTSTGRSVALTSEAAGGPHRQVGDEVVVHDVEVDQLRPAHLRPPNLLGEAGEVGREYGGRANHPVTQSRENPHASLPVSCNLLGASARYPE